MEDHIGTGMEVYFRSYVFTEPYYTPYFDAYKGHKFKVIGIPFPGHATLECIDDPSVIVKGAVHVEDLKRA